MWILDAKMTCYVPEEKPGDKKWLEIRRDQKPMPNGFLLEETLKMVDWLNISLARNVFDWSASGFV